MWDITLCNISLVFLHFLDYFRELKAKTLQMYFKKYTLTSTTVTLIINNFVINQGDSVNIY